LHTDKEIKKAYMVVKTTTILTCDDFHSTATKLCYFHANCKYTTIYKTIQISSDFDYTNT
jgi:hypothetical protein